MVKGESFNGGGGGGGDGVGHGSRGLKKRGLVGGAGAANGAGAHVRGWILGRAL